jgi:hypothetical protein
MRKIVAIIVILIIVLNAAVFLPGLTASPKEQDGEVTRPTDIELKDLRPLVLPNLVKF